jgi:hypothetical protein
LTKESNVNEENENNDGETVAINDDGSIDVPSVAIESDEEKGESVELKHYNILLNTSPPMVTRVIDTAHYDDIMQRIRSESGRKGSGFVRFPKEGQLQNTDDDGELVSMIETESIRAEMIVKVRQYFPVTCDACSAEVDPETELTEVDDEDEEGKKIKDDEGEVIKVSVILCAACLEDQKDDDDDGEGADSGGPDSPGGATIDFGNIKDRSTKEAMPVGF